MSHSILIDPVGPARDAGVDAINLEIMNFPSGEALKLHEAGYAVFLHVPRESICNMYKEYGMDIEKLVVNWVREGQLDQVISDDAALVKRIWERANVC